MIATGQLTTYPGRSRYQIVIERLELAGQGALMALLDKRRRALAAEGLFDEARKKKLPFPPRVIGVVTSPTGAVIRDILHRLDDRFPTHVILWPVPVQGEGAAEKVAAAIVGLRRAGPGRRPDLLIVARGGGSIEDLWAFNEEVVVRAVAGSAIPIISAVGHETDTTLCDFAADVRAPTPTAAAEMAVPVRAELLAPVRELGARTERCARRAAGAGGEQLQALLRRWPAREALLAPQQQRLDELGGAAAARAAQPARPRPRRAWPCRRRASPGPARLGPRPRPRAARRLVAGRPARPSQQAARARLCPGRGPRRATLISAAAAREARLLRLLFRDGAVDASGRRGG